MKVLVVGLATFDQMTGGSARYMSGLIDALTAAGHTVDVITAGQVVDTSGPLQPGALQQISRLVRRLVFVHGRVMRGVIVDPPDVVNVHFAYDGIGAVLAARLRRVPVVATFHGPWASEAVATGGRGGWPLSTRIRRWMEQAVYCSATRCIVLSSAFRDLLADEYSVPRSRIQVIPPGVALEPFRERWDRGNARRRLGLPDRPTIVSVRRLVRRMGLDLLLDALASLPREQRPHLALAGSGPEREALEIQAAALGLADDVTFLGRLADADLPVLYAAADLSVVPSRSLEGYGYVVLESYASGTPVLATSVGGLIDAVGDFDAERLVLPDAGALAGAIADALGHPDGLPDRDRCRAYADQFGWDRIAPRVEAVFAEAIVVRRGR